MVDARDLDETDLAIVRELQRNGRSSNREIARVLDISEGTVRQRLKKLEVTKAIRLGLVVDAAASGKTAAAYVRIKVEPRYAASIAQRIAKFPDCPFSGLTAGAYDVIAFINAPSREGLIALVENEIATMKGVVQLDVREPVGTLKHRYDLIHIP